MYLLFFVFFTIISFWDPALYSKASETITPCFRPVWKPILYSGGWCYSVASNADADIIVHQINPVLIRKDNLFAIDTSGVYVNEPIVVAGADGFAWEESYVKEHLHEVHGSSHRKNIWENNDTSATVLQSSVKCTFRHCHADEMSIPFPAVKVNHPLPNFQLTRFSIVH